MTLELDTKITLEEGQRLYQSAMQQAASVLVQKGIAAPNPPLTTGPGGASVPYRGEIPPDLTQLTDDHLGVYMGLITEWGNYLNYQLAEADTNLTTVKAEKALVEAHLRLLFQKDPEEKRKRSNPERDDYVGTDRRYVEVQAKVVYCNAMYTFLKTMTDNAGDSYAAISRRVTQRGQEIDRMNRTGGVAGGNIPHGPLFGGRMRR